MKSPSLVLLLLMYAFVTAGCSSDSVGTPASPAATSGTSGTSVVAIALTASPTTVSTLGTVAISATLTDSSGASVADGTAVSFSVTTNAALGTVTPTATVASGLATGTFTANSTAGTVVVTVAAGGVSATISIPILGVDVGSIQFTSATPNVIGLKGSGQAETSVLSFAVQDVNGQNASDGTNVTFSLSGPNGGEFITPLTGSTTNGVVTTTLQSGSVAGPVRVLAATVVNGKSISSISTGVSIGGGVPSLSHFTIARAPINLAGLSYSNLKSTVSVFLADRFGNFNVLKGTSVSFVTEAGAIDRSNVTDAEGITSVIFRTQNPIPLNYSTANPFGAAAPPTTGDPVNGHAMIVAMTRGEECFVDNNGNGVFDGPTIDTFPVATCDIGEPLVDFDDDGIYDSATDIFIDGNVNGVFDGGNGIWDANITIWRSAKIAITGGQPQVAVSPATISVADSSSQFYRACIADENSNALMAGSTVNVALGAGSKGTLLGGGSFVMPDILSGPYCVGFTLTDSNPAESPAVAPEGASIEITVTWVVPGHADLVTKTSIFGTVD